MEEGDYIGKIQELSCLIVSRLFGFLLGATTSGAGMYYYVIDEYRVSNQLLTEDIYVRSFQHTTVASSLANIRIGPPVCGTADRRLRPHPRGQGRCEEAISHILPPQSDRHVRRGWHIEMVADVYIME